jgi:integrase
MASIRKHGNGYQCRIRTKGFPNQSKVFPNKAQAIQWSKVVESEMVRGVFIDRSEAERTTLGEALSRYLTERTQQKRGAKQERRRIHTLIALPWATTSLAALRQKDFTQYRESRLKAVSAGTVRLELAILRNLFTVAIKDWGIAVTNPLLSVKSPKAPKGRTRRLNGDEENRLLAAVKKHGRNDWLAPLIQLAIHTGMRAGELRSMSWSDIDLKNPHEASVHLSMTKNGTERTVPLIKEAVEVFRRMPRAIGGDVFPSLDDTVKISRAFKRSCKWAGIEDLRFHDLRHEAASRFAPHLQSQELMKVMGWKAPQMVARYYHPRVKDLLPKMQLAAS